jgi:hypothetical protein
MDYGRLAYPPMSCYKIQQHRFCCVGRHRVKPDGNGLRNAHDTEGSYTTWPLRELLRYQCCAPSNGCCAVRSLRQSNPVLHNIHSGIGRALRERSRPRALCDVQHEKPRPRSGVDSGRPMDRRTSQTGFCWAIGQINIEQYSTYRGGILRS